MSVKQILNYLIKAGAIIIVLEPLWMLLPFAGFLYGSVLNLEFLKNSPYTIWLLYFIFPVQTLMLPALTLTLIGFLIFIIGAFRIYSAKIRKTGLVKTGLYKKLRNPQYTGLILLATGFLLMWGRYIAYIAFFLMLFLYYLLAKREQQLCLNQFGKEYEDYMRTSYFLFPGEKIFSKVAHLFSGLIPQKSVCIVVSFVLLMSAGTATCFGILTIRNATMENIPFSKMKISTAAGKEMNLIMVKGFKHQIKKLKISDDRNFFVDLLSALSSSPKLNRFLTRLDTDKFNTLLCFLTARTVREKKNYYKEGKADIFVMLLNSPIELTQNNFKDFRTQWKVSGALEVNEFVIAEIHTGNEPIKGEIFFHKPFAGELFKDFQRRLDCIFNIYLTGLKTKIIPISLFIEK